MVSYAPRSARALAYLKRAYNDIEIFVEDTGNHNMWLLIIRSLLKKGRHITSVNLLGGRKAVIAACKLDQQDDNRSRLYIIDGDFVLLLGKPKPRLKYLYRIRGYCIENLLLSEPALVGVGLECDPTKDEISIANLLNLSTLLNGIGDTLTPLFVTYATVNLLAPSVKTVGHSVSSLVDNNGGNPSLDAQKVRSRIRQVIREALQHTTLLDFRDVRRVITARLSKLTIHHVVSGKDYFLPLILLKYRSLLGCGLKPEQFKVAMARSYCPEIEPWFARRVRSL